MKVDSSLSHYFYQSRFQQDPAEQAEAANDAGSSTRPSTTLNPTISSTLLSPTLSSALWVIEGGRSSGKSDTTSSRTAANHQSMAQKVEAFYLEFETQE
jgi:hypothetical protein